MPKGAIIIPFRPIHEQQQRRATMAAPAESISGLPATSTSTAATGQCLRSAVPATEGSPPK